MDVLDVVEYLAGKGVPASRGAGPEVVAHCVFCPDGDPKGKGKLYVNTETWLYDCKRCGAQGNRRTLLDYYGDADEIEHAGNPSAVRQLLAEAVDLAHEMLLTNDKVMTRLLDRGLAPETILAKKYGYVPMNVGLTRMLPTFAAGKASRVDLVKSGLLTVGGKEFFNDSITIPYWSHGSVVQVREKRPDGKYRTLGGDHARLYNADSLRAADDVLVTEGEFDADIVEQELSTSADAKLRMTAVVGLPGAGSWPDGFESYFAQAKRVFVGLDPDDTGRQYAAKMRELLGTKARVVELPRELPKCDWTDYLRPKTPANPHGGHTWRDIRDLLNDADLAGKRMFTVGEARTSWSRQRSDQPGIELGFPMLDAVIRPGLKPGQIFIPLAKTGTGKSVWLSNVVHNIRSRRVLYVSLEMTKAEVFEHLRRIHHFWFPEAGPEEFDEAYARLRIVDQNRLRPGDLAAMCAEYREDVGAEPEVMVVDYLQYFSRGFRGTTAYERVSEATLEIKAIAKQEGLGVIIPSQVNREAKDGQPLDSDDARDSGVIEETGDFLLSLFRPDHIINKDGQPAVATGTFNMQLLKSRHGGKGRLFNARISNLSLVVVDVFDRKHAAMVDIENSKYREGLHYDDYRDVSIQHALPIS